MTDAPPEATREEDNQERKQVLAYLKEHGPTAPSALSLALNLPRRSLSRILVDLQSTGQVRRNARSTFDRNATFSLPN